MRQFFELVAERARSVWAFLAFAALFVAERIWHEAILRVTYWVAEQCGVTPTSVVRVALENPIVTFFGSAILVLIVIFFMAWRATTKEQQPQRIRVVMVDRAPQSSGPAVSALPAERHFIKSTPGEIYDLFRNLTSLQASKLAEPYIGIWMELSGTVGDVSEYRYITLKEDRDSSRIMSIILGFDEECRDRFTILRRGEQVRIVGQISNVTASVLLLKHCELVPEK